MSLSRRVGLSLSGDVVIEAVEVLGDGAVHVEPPVADEVLLVEEGPVGAEEAVPGETPGTVTSADVECLAVGLRVSVVSSVNLAVTQEGSVRDLEGGDLCRTEDREENSQSCR